MIDGWLNLLLLEKMNDGSQLLSINEIIHYFKKWNAGRGVLKKDLFSLQKRDASNRSS